MRQNNQTQQPRQINKKTQQQTPTISQPSIHLIIGNQSPFSQHSILVCLDLQVCNNKNICAEIRVHIYQIRV